MLATVSVDVAGARNNPPLRNAVIVAADSILDLAQDARGQAIERRGAEGEIR